MKMLVTVNLSKGFNNHGRRANRKKTNIVGNK